MRFDHSLRITQLPSRKTRGICQSYLGRQPELRFTIRV
jgi:hypothetical protein